MWASIICVCMKLFPPNGGGRRGWLTHHPPLLFDKSELHRRRNPVGFSKILPAVRTSTLNGIVIDVISMPPVEIFLQKKVLGSFFFRSISRSVWTSSSPDQQSSAVTIAATPVHRWRSSNTWLFSSSAHMLWILSAASVCRTYYQKYVKKKNEDGQWRSTKAHHRNKKTCGGSTSFCQKCAALTSLIVAWRSYNCDVHFKKCKTVSLILLLYDCHWQPPLW